MACETLRQQNETLRQELHDIRRVGRSPKRDFCHSMQPICSLFHSTLSFLLASFLDKETRCIGDTLEIDISMTPIFLLLSLKKKGKNVSLSLLSPCLGNG